MSFPGLFAIGLSGVNAYSASLEAVSNNIANTQTTGYKRLQTDFSTLIQGEAPEGGLNGGGVQGVNRQLVTEQGAITRTNSATDLAVSGDGFFIVSETADGNAATSPFHFTRSGGFNAQADGALMNEAGYFLRAAQVGDDGNAAVGGLFNLETVNINRITSLAEATSEISLTGNLDANAAPGASLTQNFQIFDADGAARNIAVNFINSAPNQWAASAAFTDGAEETIGAGTVVFGANGLINQDVSSFPQTLAISANAGQSIDLNFGSLTSVARDSQFTAASANGAPIGALTGVDITPDGRVTALFSNGLRRDIYQIALANFINAEGLEDGEGSTFLTNSAAGDISLDIPQSGRAGAIESRALEASTVDIGQEFSTLIETQRAYAANTRVISIADELWQTLTQTAR